MIAPNRLLAPAMPADRNPRPIARIPATPADRAGRPAASLPSHPDWPLSRLVGLAFGGAVYLGVLAAMFVL